MNFYQGCILVLLVGNALGWSLLAVTARRSTHYVMATSDDFAKAHQNWMCTRQSYMRLWFYVLHAQRSIFRDGLEAYDALGFVRREIKRELDLLGAEKPKHDLRPTPRQLAAELHTPYEFSDEGWEYPCFANTRAARSQKS